MELTEESGFLDLLFRLQDLISPAFATTAPPIPPPIQPIANHTTPIICIITCCISIIMCPLFSMLCHSLFEFHSTLFRSRRFCHLLGLVLETSTVSLHACKV
jgi:hypothetical protein